MPVNQEDKDNAVYVLPAGYSETEFELSEEQLAFDQFKSEAQDNDTYAKMLISRVPMNKHGQRGSQKLMFLFSCGVEDYTFDQLLSKLRDEYGSGFYKIQGRNEKGQLKLNKTVAVEAPITDTDTAKADSGNGAVIESVSQLLQRHTEQMQNMVPNANPTGSMLEMMQGIAAIMGAMGVHPPQPPPPPKTLIEQLTEFKMLKELMSGDGDSGESGDANIYSLLGKTVDAFGGPLMAALAQGQQAGQIDENGIATPQALPSPETPTEVDKVKEDEQHKLYMRKQIHILLQNAKTGIPAKQFALIVVSNTPEEQEDALWEFISAENCIDQMVALEPAAEAFREWLNELRTEVINLMSEPEDEDLTTGNDKSKTADSSAVAGVESETTTSGHPDNGDAPVDT